FSPGRSLGVHTRWDVHMSGGALLASPADRHTAQLRSLEAARISSQARVAVERYGTMHAIAAWFSATSETNVVISNDPSEPVGAFPKQALFPIDRPIAVAAGDRIDIVIRLDTMDREMVWTW